MLVFITSSGRPDLLEQTIVSFTTGITLVHDFGIIINEDISNPVASKKCIEIAKEYGAKILTTDKKGQHFAIENFLKNHAYGKYYIHLEDDWEFDNSYDWIQASIDIMESDNSIIKVLCRKDTEHPCVHDLELNGLKYGIIKPWTNENIKWYGFSWNPGVTRIDLLKQFVPFPKWEQDVAECIHWTCYKVAELEKKVYKHIGYGRSTH